MNVHWDAVIQGAMTGLVGAGVLATLVGCRNRIRNGLLKRQIRRNLNRMSLGSGINGVTTSIHNQSGREMTVRQVSFLMGATYIVLIPSQELMSSYKGQNRKPTRAEIRRMKKGEMIEIEKQMQFKSWNVPPTQAGFVTLPPYSKTSFILPAEFMANSVDPLQSIRIVLEYLTKTGEKKILQHDVKPRHPQHVQNTLDRFHEELRSGNFNRARRRFHMPEITVKPKSDRDCNDPPNAPPTA